MSHPSTIGDYEKMCYLLMEEHGIEKRGEENSAPQFISIESYHLHYQLI